MIKSKIFVDVKFPLAGIANKLLVLGKGIKFCIENDARVLRPEFSQLAIGPILRGEPDWRFYFSLFDKNKNEVSGLKK